MTQGVQNHDASRAPMGTIERKAPPIDLSVTPLPSRPRYTAEEAMVRAYPREWATEAGIPASTLERIRQVEADRWESLGRRDNPYIPFTPAIDWPLGATLFDEEHLNGLRALSSRVWDQVKKDFLVFAGRGCSSLQGYMEAVLNKKPGLDFARMPHTSYSCTAPSAIRRQGYRDPELPQWKEDRAFYLLDKFIPIEKCGERVHVLDFAVTGGRLFSAHSFVEEWLRARGRPDVRVVTLPILEHTERVEFPVLRRAHDSGWICSHHHELLRAAIRPFYDRAAQRAIAPVPPFNIGEADLMPDPAVTPSGYQRFLGWLRSESLHSA